MRAFRAPRSRKWAPDPRAVAFADAWGRYTTRSAPADRGGFRSAQDVGADLGEDVESRYDVDLERASVVEYVLMQLGNGETLRRLILHIHAQGKAIEEFSPLRPGQRVPAELVGLGYYSAEAMVLAAYRRFMTRLDRAIEEGEQRETDTLSPAIILITVVATVDATTHIDPSGSASVA